MRVVKNYRNKNTQTNKIIISTMSKEKKKKKKPFWIGDGDEVSKKLRQSKSLCKEIEKDKYEIYLNRDSVC